jgi:hypothetical protein
MRGDNMSDYLVPGSIRLDCRLIGEEEEEDEEEVGKKWKKKWTFLICRNIAKRKRRRMIDAECRDMHNPVNITRKMTCFID